MMDRRKFMALLPSLSAAPFMAREILQTDDKIEIIQPQIITRPPITWRTMGDWGNWTVHFIYQEHIIGKGRLTSLSFNTEMGHIPASSEIPYVTYTPGLRGIDFSGVLTGELKL